MKLAFYRSVKGTWLDSLVDLMSGRYGYSHVELVFDRQSKELPDGVYSCFSSSPREGKCRFKHINMNNDKWYIVDIPMSEEREQIILENALYLTGEKYDYWGILFWFVLGTKKQDDLKWWCSEVIAYLLGHSDFRISPNRLAKLYSVPKSEFKLIIGR